MTRLKSWFLKTSGGNVERIVVLGGVERLPHGCRVTAILVHRAENPGHGAVHG